MSLDARRRASLYGKFIPLLGEDDANALMTEFPASEADELVTKEFHRAESALLRSEFQSSMGELRSELRSEFQSSLGELRSEFQSSLGELRSEFMELRSEFVEFRVEVNERFAGVEGRIARLEVDMADRFRQQTVLFGGAFAAMTAILGTLISLN